MFPHLEAWEYRIQRTAEAWFSIQKIHAKKPKSISIKVLSLSHTFVSVDLAA
jgi:hypothetical protein